MNVGNVEGAIRLKDEFSKVIADAIKQLDTASARIDKSLGNIAKSMTQVRTASTQSAASLKQYTAAGAQLKATLDGQIRQLTGLEAAYQQGGSAVARYTQQLRIEQALLKAGVQATSQQGQAIARRIMEVDRLTAAVKNLQVAEREQMAKAAQKPKQYTAEGAELKQDLSQQIAAMTGLSAAYKKGKDAVARYNTEQRIAAELARVNVSAESLQGRAIADRIRQLDKLTAEIKKQKAAQDGASHSMGGAVGAAAKMRAGISGLIGGLFNLRSLLYGIGIANLVNEIKQAQVAFDQMRFSLRVVLPSLSAVGGELSYVRSESERLGLNFATAGKSFAWLAAASRDTGITLETVRKLFDGTSTAATALGLSSDTAAGAFNAMVQMMTKGTVQAEELRGQLGDRIPGAIQMAARAMNMSTVALNDMLKKGDVLATELLPKLADEMLRVYGPAAQGAAHSLNAELNRLSTAFFNFFTSLSGGLDLTEWVRSFTKAINEVTEAFQSPGAVAGLKELSKVLSDVVGLALSILPPLIENLDTIVSLLKAMIVLKVGNWAITQAAGLATLKGVAEGTVVAFTKLAGPIVALGAILFAMSDQVKVAARRMQLDIEGIKNSMNDAGEAAGDLRAIAARLAAGEKGEKLLSQEELDEAKGRIKQLATEIREFIREKDRMLRGESEKDFLGSSLVSPDAKEALNNTNHLIRQNVIQMGNYAIVLGRAAVQSGVLTTETKKVNKEVDDLTKRFNKLMKSHRLEIESLGAAALAYSEDDLSGREAALDAASVENELRREAIDLTDKMIEQLRPLIAQKIQAARVVEGEKTLDALRDEISEVTQLTQARSKSIPALNSVTKRLAVEAKVRDAVAKAAKHQRAEIERNIRAIEAEKDALEDQNLAEDFERERDQLLDLIAAYEDGPMAVAQMAAAQERSNKIREITNKLTSEQAEKFKELIAVIVDSAETVEKLDIGAKLDEEIRQMEKALSIRTTSFHSIRGLEQAQRDLNIQLDYERAIMQSKVVLSEQEKKDIRDKIARTYELAQAMEDASDDAVTLSQKMYGFAEGLDDAFADASDSIKEVASGVGGLIKGFAQLLDAGKDLTKQMGAWASMAQGLQSVLEGMGAFQTGRGGGFGGSSEGNYAAEGQQIGAIIGGIIGAMVGAPQVGMAIGAAAGGILGGFIKKGADEALAKLTFDFTGFNMNINKAEGQLRGAMQDLGDGIALAVMDVVAAIGGTIVGLPEVSMKIRDGVIGVVIGGVKRKFEEMDDAISFAVSELIKQGDILGLDKMLLDAIRGSGARNVEALASDIEDVLKVMNFGLTESQIAIGGFTAELDALSQKMVRLLGSSDQLGRALANIAAEEGRRWQQLRDQITGHQKSNAELLKEKQQDALMFNAEKALRIADLKMQKASLEAQAAVLQGKLELWNNEIKLGKDILQREAQILDTRMRLETAWVEGMALITEKIAAIVNLIDIIGAIPDIDIGEIRLPGGAGGGATGPSPGEQAADDLAALMEQLAATARDLLPQWESALANLNFQMQQQIELAHGDAEALRIINEQYQQQIDNLVAQAEASLGIPWIDMVNRLNEFAEALEFLRSQAQAAQDAANAAAGGLAELTPEMERFIEVTGWAREQIGLQMLGLIADIYEAMGYDTKAAEFRAKIAKIEFAFKVAELKFMVQFYGALGMITQEIAQEVYGLLRILSDPENWPDFEVEPPEPPAPPRPDPHEDERDELLERLIASIEDLKNTLKNYQDFLMSLERGPLSGATLRNQFLSAQSDFQEMLAKARAGDMEAIRELPGMAEEFLQIASQYMDPSSAAYQQLLAMVRGSMSGIAGGIETIIDAAPESALGSNGVLDTIAEILAAMASRWGVNPGWHPGGAILPGPGGPMPWGRNDPGGISGQASFNNSMFNSLFGQPLRVRADQLDDIADELKMQRLEIAALRSSTDYQTETMKRADFARPTLSNRDGGGGSKPKASATGA